MIRKLTKQGNSTCLVIERQIRELLDITTETPLKLTIEGRRLVVEPLTDEERKIKFRKALADTQRVYAPALKKLAK